MLEHYANYQSQGQTMPHIIVDIGAVSYGKPFNFCITLSQSSGQESIAIRHSSNVHNYVRHSLPLRLIIGIMFKHAMLVVNSSNFCLLTFSDSLIIQGYIKACSLSQLAMGCVTCHTCHGCVTDFRPILGNPMEVTHVTSPGHVYIFPC